MKLRGLCHECDYSATAGAHPDHEGDFLICRRYAPRPIEGTATSARVAWPLVRPVDSCGEFFERQADGDRDPLQGFTVGSPSD